MSRQAETVGGPVDVAVISKGDGLIWMKRKHYFEPGLNPSTCQQVRESLVSKHRSERENGQPKVLRSIADYDRLALAREKTIAEPKAMANESLTRSCMTSRKGLRLPVSPVLLRCQRINGGQMDRASPRWP